MKILIIRFSSIGDIVLTTPVIRGVKLQLRAEVHYAVKKQYRTILDSNPYIDKVHVLEDSLPALREALRLEHFDFVLDLHHNLRTRILLATLPAPVIRFNKLNLDKWLMVNFKINRLPNKHIVDRYLDTAVGLGVKNDGAGLDYFIPLKDEVPVAQFTPAFQQGYVAYAIGGQHATKKLPVERMIELCEVINEPIILLGGKEDHENGEVVRIAVGKKSPAGQPIINCCGLFNLNQSASVLKNARLVFSHDSGLMHIAAALKKEVYAIWGNTIPEFGMYPYQTKFTNLENNGLYCRPCSKIGYEKCPKKHFKCMREIEFNLDLKRENPG